MQLEGRRDENGVSLQHSLVWRAHSEASCRGNSLCAALVAAPQKETNSGKDVAGCMLSPLHLR